MALADSMTATFDRVLAAVARDCAAYYGERLVALAVFGSVARGTARPNSDIDLLIVADPLPDGRWARVREFDAVEHAMAPTLRDARNSGLTTELSPMFKTPQEITSGSPLLLDMTDDARVLVDRDGVLKCALDAFRVRLASLGARRVWRGNAWYWDLKPDYRPGEVFDL
jgi:predicted nucleotidyltransferase